MPNYYYVKLGGTADGSTIDSLGTNGISNTLLTGAWPLSTSEYFNNIASAMGNVTNPPTGDDILILSDLHSYTHTGDYGPIGTGKDGVTLISVDDANREVYKRGALEQTINNSWYFRISSSINVKGVNIGSGDITTIYGKPRASWSDAELYIRYTGTSRYLYLVGTGRSGVISFDNMDLKFDPSGIGIVPPQQGSVVFKMNGGTATGGGSLVALTQYQEGGSLIFENVDLSGMDNGAAILNLISEASVFVQLHRCKLPVNFIPISTVLTDPIHTLDISNCDKGEGCHYFYYSDERGFAEIDKITYLDASYDGVNKFSVAVSTTSVVSNLSTFRYKIASIPAQDLTTAKSVIVECTSDAGLTDDDVHIEIDVDETLGTTLSTQNTDPLSAGTILTSSTSSWTVPDAANYVMIKEIGAFPTVYNGQVSIYVCVSKPNIDVNFNLPRLVNS